MLNTLMYDGIGDYDGAIRAFQTDLGQQPTGELTVWQIRELQFRSEMQSASPPIIAAGFFTDLKIDNPPSDGYAEIKGTLQMLHEKAAFPVNFVRVECHQRRGYCTLDEVDLQFPSRHGFAPSFTVYWNDPFESDSKFGDDIYLSCDESCRPSDGCDVQPCFG